MHYHSFLFSVMCKCSYLNEEDLKTRRNRVVLPSSASSSQVTTPKNNISSPSSSTSQREISTTFFSSPRSPKGGPNTPRFSSSPRQSQALEARSTAWVAKDEARSGGSTPRIFLPQLKQGKLKRRVTIGSSLSASSGSGDAEEADWPPFADEDYIVFFFEEDGAFHVVLEESPKTNSQKLQCEEHGNLTCACSDETKVINQLKILNRRDCLLPNKEAEEEPTSNQLSPMSLIDVGDHLLANNKLILENESTESMECRNGSVESTDSSQLDDDDQFDNEIEHLSSHWSLTGQDGEDEISLSALRRDCSLPNTVADEESSTLSSKSQMTVMFRIDELLKGDNDVSSIESDQSSGFSESESRGDNEEQLERNEELISESAKSSISRKSKSSIGSFKFPVLECEWIGSPVKWPKSERVHYRRHRSRPECLTCCNFWKISNLSS